jgi:hypothetical protein
MIFLKKKPKVAILRIFKIKSLDLDLDLGSSMSPKCNRAPKLFNFLFLLVTKFG